MPVRKRGSGYQVDVQYKGRRVRRQVPVRTLALAREVERDLRDRLVAGEFIQVEIRFVDFCTEYLEAKSATMSPASIRTTRAKISSVLTSAFGDRLIHTITSHDIERWRSRRARQVRPITANSDLGYLRAILQAALEWKYLSRNPAEGIKRISVPAGSRDFYDSDEVSSLLAADIDPMDHMTVALAIYTGMRSGEIMSLEWSDIDMRRGVIEVRNKSDFRTKSGRDRTIGINPALAGDLRKHPRRLGCDHVLHHDGDRYLTLQKMWNRIVSAAGVRYLKFHALRHTCASHLVMSGADLPTVQKMLGHANISTLMIYSHLSPDHVRHAADLLDFDTSASRGRHKDISKGG